VDGSTIVLNTDTEIDADLARGTRSIKLIRGEAEFEVAKDSRRPFLVYAGDHLVKAVGTAFTVCLRQKNVEVMVSEGVVELLARNDVERGGQNASLGVPGPEAFTPLRHLAANTTAVVGKKVERVQSLSKEAVDQKLL